MIVKNLAAENSGSLKTLKPAAANTSSQPKYTKLVSQKSSTLKSGLQLLSKLDLGSLKLENKKGPALNTDRPKTKKATPPSKVLVQANSTQAKLNRIIETKFAESTMRNYAFPGRKMSDESKDCSLKSLVGVFVYNLHSQNNRTSQPDPLASTRGSQPRTSSPPIVQGLTKLDLRSLSRESSRPKSRQAAATDRPRGDSKKPTLPPAAEITELLRRLAKKPKNKEGKGLLKISAGHKSSRLLGAGIHPSAPSSSQPKDMYLKYLQKGKKLDLTRQSEVDEKSNQEGSLSRVRNFQTVGLGLSLTGPSKRLGLGSKVKSFSQLLKKRDNPSIDKYKGLQLASLGPASSSLETKLKNTQSFHFTLPQRHDESRERQLSAEQTASLRKPVESTHSINGHHLGFSRLALASNTYNSNRAREYLQFEPPRAATDRHHYFGGSPYRS
jgi:hypothetical protein